MALMPKRPKWRKPQKGKIRCNASRGNKVSYGEFGLQSLDKGRITNRQIEAGRIASQRQIPNTGKLFIRIFPHRSWTSIPLETRMGKGKGEPDYWAAIVRPGTVIFEIGGVPLEIAKMALAKTAQKMPVRCRLVTRRKY